MTTYKQNSSSLLLLSHFSRVWLCATPQMAAHQAPPFLGFSRQEHWSGLPFSSPMHESEKWKWSHSVVSVQLLATPWTAANQASLSMGFSRQSTGVGCHCLICKIFVSSYKMPIFPFGTIVFFLKDVYNSQLICNIGMIAISWTFSPSPTCYPCLYHQWLA